MKTNQNLKDLDHEEIYIAPKFYDCFDFKTYSKELMIFRSKYYAACFGQKLEYAVNKGASYLFCPVGIKSWREEVEKQNPEAAYSYK